MQNENLYFAYGSNLNSEDWKRFCDENRFQPDSLESISTAWLPDHELAFDYRSKSRGGGVLDVRPSIGKLAPGVVFRVHADGWEALDRKEGHPDLYERFETVVLDEDGQEMPVITYRVREGKRDLDGFVEPTAEYLEIVKKGYEAHGLESYTDMLEAAAQGQQLTPAIDSIFVYGTLMRGEPRFPILQKHGPQCALLAQVFGRLLHLGEYPGMVIPSELHNESVQGEFVRVKNIAKALEELDWIEGFRGYGKPDSLFRRTLTNVEMHDGRIRRAWVYVYAGGETARVIESGCWRTEFGRRSDFLEALVRTHCGGQSEEAISRRLATRGPFPSPEEDVEVMRLMPLAEALEAGEFSERELAQASGKWVVVPKPVAPFA